MSLHAQEVNALCSSTVQWIIALSPFTELKMTLSNCPASIPLDSPQVNSGSPVALLMLYFTSSLIERDVYPRQTCVSGDNGIRQRSHDLLLRMELAVVDPISVRRGRTLAPV